MILYNVCPVALAFLYVTLAQKTRCPLELTDTYETAGLNTLPLIAWKANIMAADEYLISAFRRAILSWPAQRKKDWKISRGSLG